METDRAHTTVSFPVVRFNAVLKLLAANRRPCLTFSAALANSVVQRNRVLATGSLAQGEEDLSRHSFGFAGGLLREQAQVLQQNPEGVTAKAHQGVALAGAITKPLRNALQQAVAAFVTYGCHPICRDRARSHRQRPALAGLGSRRGDRRDSCAFLGWTVPPCAQVSRLSENASIAFAKIDIEKAKTQKICLFGRLSNYDAGCFCIKKHLHRR